MKLRIKFMYEKEMPLICSFLLESQSIGEAINKAEYIKQLYDYDRKMLEAYSDGKDGDACIKEQLEDERAELEAQQHELRWRRRVWSLCCRKSRGL